MFFRYQTAKLEYDGTGKEYIHPVTGECSGNVLDCLRGWKEPDQSKRHNWGILVKSIQEFWETPESSGQISKGDEIDFS
jgi:hypothetical protein